MAKFTCVCGQVLTTSGNIPHPYQWSLISDVDFDGLSGMIDADQLYMESTLMLRCPASGHLWVYWSGLDELPTLYDPAPPP